MNSGWTRPGSSILPFPILPILTILFILWHDRRTSVNNGTLKLSCGFSHSAGGGGVVKWNQVTGPPVRPSEHAPNTLFMSHIRMSEPARRPHLLLTNDDGIHADGLAALAAALEPHADLTIVAPAEECSGFGHSITIARELKLEPVGRDGVHWGWSLCGTPADCTKMAVTELSKDRPFDLVISGINRGQNAGVNVLYSGTVAAAREGAIWGLPAIAVSLFYTDRERLYWDTAARVAVEVFHLVRRHGLPRGTLLNVNVPPLPYDELKGWVVTRMSNAAFSDSFQRHESEEQAVAGEPPTAGESDSPGAVGLPGAAGPAGEAGPANGIYKNVGTLWNPSVPQTDDADDHALYAGHVSISPLHFDLTDYAFLPELKSWMNGHGRD